MNRRPAGAYAVFLAMLLVGSQGSHAAIATDHEYAKNFGALASFLWQLPRPCPWTSVPFALIQDR